MWRDLGTAPMKAFQGQAVGMEQTLVFNPGKPGAVVYSLRTGDGRYVEERQYFFGGSELSIETPRTRRARRGTGREGNWMTSCLAAR